MICDYIHHTVCTYIIRCAHYRFNDDKKIGHIDGDDDGVDDNDIFGATTR